MKINGSVDEIIDQIFTNNIDTFIDSSGFITIYKDDFNNKLKEKNN